MALRCRCWKYSAAVALLLATVPQGHTAGPDAAGSKGVWEQRSADEEEALQLNRRTVDLSKEGRIDEAIPLARRALMLSEKIHGSIHPNVSADLITLADLYRRQGDYFNAENMIQRAIKIDTKLHGAEHPEVAVDMGSLAMLYAQKGDLKSAAQNYRQAIDLLDRSEDLARFLPSAAEIHYGYGETLRGLGENELAKQYFLNAEQLFEMIGQRDRAIEVLITAAEHARTIGDQVSAEMLLRRIEKLRNR